MCGCKDKKKCGCKTKFVACVGPKGDKGDTGPQGPPGDIFFEVKIALTPAQVKTASSNRVLLVAAPGAGKAIVVICATARRQYVSTPYTITTADIRTLGSAADQVYIPSTVFFSSSEGTPGDSKMVNLVRPVSINENVFDNVGIYFCTDSDSSVGDDLIFLYITYKIITL